MGRLRVLFLCTGNSARSQLAEALLRDLSGNRIDVFSAGTDPQPAVHPVALDVLRERYQIEPGYLYPKPIDQFTNQQFDYVITVCDRAQERCPFFPGDPERIHWGFEDPATVEEDAQREAFERVADGLFARLRVWMAYAETHPKDSPRPPSGPVGSSDLLRRQGAPTLRTAAARKFRTSPPADAPVVMVVYFGTMRRCINMCAYLERSGFQVYCGDVYGREPETIGLIPDVVLVRADEPLRTGHTRIEFDALPGIRRVLSRTPIVVALPGSASAEEQMSAQRAEASIIQSHGFGGYTSRVLMALEQIISPPRS